MNKYAMMIICSLIKSITIHTHIHKKMKNNIPNTNNYCDVLTLYSLNSFRTYSHRLLRCIRNKL